MCLICNFIAYFFLPGLSATEVWRHPSTSRLRDLAERSGHVTQLRIILAGASCVASALKTGQSVLVHCSDGWSVPPWFILSLDMSDILSLNLRDRTPQTTALAQVSGILKIVACSTKV